MSTEDRPEPTNGALGSGEALGELIRHAGRRPTSEDYRMGDFKPEALRRWQSVVARRRRHLRFRKSTYVALAAAAALGAATLALRLVVPAAPEPVGIVERVAGQLRSALAAEERPLLARDAIAAGTSLSTGPAGRAALRLATGIALRLDHESVVRLVSPTRLELERGTVYVDATGSEGAPLEIETSLGIVRHVGTVYTLTQAESSISVRVREGRVAILHDRGRLEADAGTRMTLAADGTVETVPIAIHGGDWAWTLDVSPAFELEGATLGAYLDWLVRETGWYVRFEGGADPGLRRTILHGSLTGIRPEATPDAVLPGCGLSYRREGGSLILEPDGATRTRS